MMVASLEKQGMRNASFGKAPVEKPALGGVMDMLYSGDEKRVKRNSADENEDSITMTGSFSVAGSMASTSSMRSCLKRTSSVEEIAVDTRRRVWKSLAPPDMEVIRRNSSLTCLQNSDSSLDESVRSLRRSSSVVSFKDIQVREYDQTVSDNPSVSYGPPIGLDWKYEENDAVDVEDYESQRGKRRNLRQMVLNYYARTNTLQWKYGVSESELKQATKAVHRAQRQRAVTKYFLPVSKVEEAAQSAGRKFKRVMKKGRQETV